MLQTVCLNTGGKKGWIGQHGKSYGQVEDERQRAVHEGNDMQILELTEQALLLRAQMRGVWSDAYRSDVNYVTPGDLRELVVLLNKVGMNFQDYVGTSEHSFECLRKAERLIKDKAFVGDGKERRKLEAITFNNLAATFRRRGRMRESMVV